MKKIFVMMFAALAAMQAGAQNPKTEDGVRLIRNATLHVDYAGRRILLDPMLSEKGTTMSALGVNLNPRVHLAMPVSEVLDDVDFVLLTHAHIDHYDEAARRAIPKRMRWYVQPSDVDTVAVKGGFSRTTAIDDRVEADGITIIRIAGNHGRGELARMMGPSSGYVLKAAGHPTLYIMGDCVWDESTQRAVAEHRPDYIVVNSGGAILPPLSRKDGPIIPDEAETMRIIDESPAGTRFIAVHMDAVDHGQTTRAILRNEARHHGVKEGVLIIPEDGERIEL